MGVEARDPHADITDGGSVETLFLGWADRPAVGQGSGAAAVLGRAGSADDRQGDRGKHERCDPPPRRSCLVDRTRRRTGSASFHSITSSARARSDCGTVMPSLLAVFRLMTSSNLVGCSTGRSAGLAPFRIFPT